MDEKRSDLDDPDRFEKRITPHGIGYHPKNYPGPIAIDAKLAQPSPDWELPPMPKSNRG